MTEREVGSFLIGFVVGIAIASVSVGIFIDDGWRKYCVSKGAATYVEQGTATKWAWKEDK